MLQINSTTMSLMTLVRRVTMIPSTPALPQVLGLASSPLTSVLKVTPILTSSPLRTYMKNFNNENNNIGPVFGWMHQNRARQGYRTGKGRREYIATYSDAKRVRTYGWEKRMSSEGGRKMIMRRILRAKDHLAH
jgi:ribosomal protein L34